MADETLCSIRLPSEWWQLGVGLFELEREDRIIFKDPNVVNELALSRRLYNEHCRFGLFVAPLLEHITNLQMCFPFRGNLGRFEVDLVLVLENLLPFLGFIVAHFALKLISVDFVDVRHALRIPGAVEDDDLRLNPRS